MTSHQRRRGKFAALYRSFDQTDRRGNKVRVVSMTERPADHPDGVNPIRVRAHHMPERSAKAEVIGQQGINIIRLLVPANLPDIDLYSRVEYDDKTWDVAAPPASREGTRHTEHWSLTLRQR